MKSTYIKVLLITTLSICSTGTKAQNTLKDINGFWKCYSNLQDTLKGCKDCFWISFDGATMQTFLSSGASAPEAVGEKTSYELKNNVLKTSQAGKAVKLKITVYHHNFISYTIPVGTKTETVYLKREMKKP